MPKETEQLMTKTISIRMSSEEYEILKDYCWDNIIFQLLSLHLLNLVKRERGLEIACRKTDLKEEI